MEANKVIFEHQVRKVVRQELINVLNEQGVLNEGIFDRIIKPSLFAAILTLGGHTVAAGGGSGGDESGGKTIQQVLEDAGMTEKVLSELEIGLTQEDIEKLKDLYETEKQLEKQLEAAKEKQDIEQVKKLESRISNLLPSALQDEEQRQRFMETGTAIHQYLRSLPADAIEEIGDPQQEEIMRSIQSKALTYQIKPETQSKNITQAAVSDLNNIFKIAKDEVGYQGGKQETIISWAVENYMDQLPEKFDLIDIIKIADQENKINSELVDPSNFKEKRVKELAGTLPDMSKDEAKAIYFGDTAGIQNESKINKLRKRLNEIRGLYV
jgi:transcriptional regulator with XRE-family HTH domain